MTGSALSSHWSRWRQKRRAQYLRNGATPKQADAGSRIEAEGRQRIESHAGRRAALAAEFGLVPARGGGETLGFVIDPSLIDLPDQDAAYKALKVHAVGILPTILCGAARREGKRPRSCRTSQRRHGLAP